MHERVRNPLLTDISIDWNGLPVTDVYPKTVPDLFSAKPLVLTGRYTGNGRGTIRLKGKMAGRDFVREIPVDFSSSQQHDVLATLWARTRVDDLMSQDFKGAQQGTMQDEVKQAITQLGLDYRLMTQFTSFVAVEEMIVTDGGQPRRIDVPVEVPEGVNRAGIFGQETETDAIAVGRGTSNLYMNAPMARPMVVTKSTAVAKTKGPRSGGGGSVVAGGVLSTAPPPKNARVMLEEPVDVTRVPSPEEQKRRDFTAKFHPTVLAVIDRLKDHKPASADEAKFIRNGKAEVQIWLTEKTDETMAKLKELGFEVVLDPKTAKLVIGRISIEKLAALADLKGVRYVGPQMTSN
jgi:hypothetical protein